MSSSGPCSSTIVPSSRPFNLEKLPRDSLNRISYFLEIPDLAAFSETSKTCYNAANNRFFVWKPRITEIKMRYIEGETTQKIKERIKKIHEIGKVIPNRSLTDRYNYARTYAKQLTKIKDPITFENTQATLRRIHVANQIRDTLIVWEEIYDQLTDKAVVRRPNFDELKQSTNKNAIKDAFATWIEQNKSNITGTSLFLMSKQLHYLPKALFELTQLQRLSIRGNNLTSLPPEIGYLTNLQGLGLSNNNLTTLPPEIRYLTNLQQLYLWGNKLTTLPPEIRNLTNLQYLHLMCNNLTTLPPEIRYLTQLQRLYLENNNLTSLPPEIRYLTQLQYLDLENNNLTTLPPEIGNLTNLQGLDLGDNNLTSLPPEIGNLTNLQGLGLLNNNLTSLPPEIGYLTQLQRLYLEDNELTTLPPEIGNLTQLQHLDLRGNKLTTLPPEIGYLTQLRHLNLRDNKLTSLPGEIGNLTQLRHLYLMGNNLTTLPPEIGNLTHLNSRDRFNNASSVFSNRLLLNTIIHIPTLKNIPTNLKKVVTVTVMLIMIHLCSDRMFLP